MIHLLGEYIGMEMRAGIVRRPPAPHGPSGIRTLRRGALPAAGLSTISTIDDKPACYATLCRARPGTMMFSFGLMPGPAGQPPAPGTRAPPILASGYRTESYGLSRPSVSWHYPAGPCAVPGPVRSGRARIDAGSRHL